ncbi:MAG: hypothetical protein Q9182_007338 [Xanthomendoza sp. 2 TL-2023]
MVSHINVPTPLPGLSNATTMVGVPLMEHSRAICSPFYGTFPGPRDCLNAINKLPTGSEEVPYIIDQREDPGHLPMSRQSGNCMVQIEIAGPRVPKTFPIVPDTIRLIATYLLEGACHKDDSYGGGFITGDLNDLVQWLISPEGELDKPMRKSKKNKTDPSPPGSNPFIVNRANADRLSRATTTALSTAFLTLSVTTPFSEYISPGNYDPQMAYTFFLAEKEAATRLPPASRAAARLRARASRLLKQQLVMEPRGRRIPWWGNPDAPPRLGQERPAGNATQDALKGTGGLEVVESLGFGATAGAGPQGGHEGTGTTATARKERRRRGAGRGEEGVMV